MNARLNHPAQRRIERMQPPRIIEMDCFDEPDLDTPRMTMIEKLEVGAGAVVVLLILTICALGLAI